MYYVYLVRCSDNSLYCGIATELQRRIEEHNNSPKGAKYTKPRRPVTLVYWEEYNDRSTATKREMEIKLLAKTKKEMLLVAFNKPLPTGSYSQPSNLNGVE